MDKLNRDIHRFYLINSHDMKTHAGGKHRDNEVIYKGHKMYYNISPNTYGDINTLIINGGRDAGRRPCFHMTMTDKVATLISLERGTDCFVDRHNNTRDTVELAFLIAKERGCTVFQLTDNSFIQCKDGLFHLADVYFISTGQTWYESILPIKINKYDDAQMTHLRNIAMTNKWAPISKYLIGRGVNLDFLKPVIKDIDPNSKGSAMKVFKIIKAMKNDVSCRFFDKQMPSIIIASGLQELHGTVWTYRELSTDLVTN
jgi:hypothetical protein